MNTAGRTGALGAVLVLACWAGNWLATEGVLRTHLLFFPQWLGAILVGDALVLKRSGRSLLTDGAGRFARLFGLSIPLWWLFEVLNLRTGNWEYLGREQFGDLEYALLASLSFSTVVPAVLTAAELVLTFRWTGPLARGPCLAPAPGLLFAAGWACLFLLLAWPGVFYPLLWVVPVLVFEPVCAWRGRASILADVKRGDWRRTSALCVGTLGCGFLWELWNFGSYPKWTYHTPGMEFLHVFEMPLAGYLGYLPFGLAVYTLTRLLWRDAPALALR